MALHGQVMVNNQVLSWWSARRTAALEDEDATYTYQCEVVWKSADLSKPFPRVQFEVEHQYSKGANALAAKVLGYVTAEVPQ